MRIISGQYKGRRLTPPKNISARPTTDFAKESLFNILENSIDFQGLKALDLFAGVGNISFELASRGASKIVAIEQNPKVFNFLLKTIKELGAPITAYRTDVYRSFQKLDAPFDLIFADPPYKNKRKQELPSLLIDNQLLKKGGILIVEHGKDDDFREFPYFSELRVYGSVNFSFFIYE